MTNDDPTRHLHDGFVAEVERFLRETGMPPSKLGTLALGNPSFVRRLREGLSPSLMVAGRVLEFINRTDHQPEDLRDGRRKPGTEDRQDAAEQVLRED